jgi:hypothetical protein
MVIPPSRPHFAGSIPASALAHALGGGLLQMDDRAAVAVARGQEIRVTARLACLRERL